MENDKNEDIRELLKDKTLEQKKIILKTKHMINYYHDVFIYCCDMTEDEADKQIAESVKKLLKDKINF